MNYVIQEIIIINSKSSFLHYSLPSVCFFMNDKGTLESKHSEGVVDKVAITGVTCGIS